MGGEGGVVEAVRIGSLGLRVKGRSAVLFPTSGRVSARVFFYFNFLLFLFDPMFDVLEGMFPRPRAQSSHLPSMSIREIAGKEAHG